MTSAFCVSGDLKMKTLTGMTVADLIAQLQKLPPETLVVTEAGDATVAPLSAVEMGYAYQYTSKNDHGGTHLHCTSKKDLQTLDERARDSAVPAAWIQ